MMLGPCTLWMHHSDLFVKPLRRFAVTETMPPRRNGTKKLSEQPAARSRAGRTGIADDVEATEVLADAGQEDVDMGMEDVSSHFLSKRKPQYTVERYDGLTQKLYEMIQSVTDLLEISPTCARLLMSHKKWNDEDVVAFYYDHSQEEVSKAIGVPLKAMMQTKNAFKTGSGGSIVMCPICVEDVKDDRIGFLACRHKYCLECWAQHLTAQITGEINDRVVVKCMEPDCKMIVEDMDVINLVEERRVVELYRKLVETKFVDSLPRLFACRGLNCTYAMRVEITDIDDEGCVRMKCTNCGHVQCSACKQDGHEGLPCWLVEKWKKKVHADTDYANLQWLMVNTKECPRCQFNIQKNGGCDHMTCRKCKMEFCWLCGDPWQNHRSCNTYCGDQKGENFTEKAWELAERLVFYASGYSNQITSIKNEKRLSELHGRLTDVLESASETVRYADFLPVTLDWLSECRRTLWQFVGFSYFLQWSLNRELFDHNLGNLENDVTELSGCLEQELQKDLDDDVLRLDVRLKIMDLTDKCKVRRKCLLDHIAEGFSKDWWKFAPDG